MDFPSLPPTPLFVHTWTRWGAADSIIGPSGGSLGSPASLTWSVANTAYYIPMIIPWPYQVRRVFWINGSSVTTVNMDFGIYTADGTKIYSTGSTAEAGASATQYVTPTEFLLSPGPYYFALACSSITANRGGQGNNGVAVNKLRIGGVLQQATALPLPATMTGAAVANSIYPICGVTRTTTGF